MERIGRPGHMWVDIILMSWGTTERSTPQPQTCWRVLNDNWSSWWVLIDDNSYSKSQVQKSHLVYNPRDFKEVNSLAGSWLSIRSRKSFNILKEPVVPYIQLNCKQKSIWCLKRKLLNFQEKVKSLLSSLFLFSAT